MNARAAALGRLRSGYGALVAGLAAAVWVASRAIAPAAVPSLYSGYQPTDPIVAQLIEPVLRAPWIGALPWLFAGLLALCLVSEAWLLATVYGASQLAAAVAVIAMMTTVGWTGSVRNGGGLTIALALSWLTWLFLGRRSASSEPEAAFAPSQMLKGSARFTGVGLVSWMAAIALSWLAFIIVPMVLAALTIGEQRKRVRAGLVALGLVAGLVGVGLYCARMAALTTSLTASALPTVSSLDVLGQMFDPAHGPLAATGGDLGAASLLAIGLAAFGAAGASARRRWRGGVVLSALLGAGIAMLWPFWRAAVWELVIWLSTPFVAVGLTMVARAILPKREAIATVAAGAVLCAVSVSDRFPFHAAPASPQSEPLARVLTSLTTEAALFVVEDLDVDAGIIGAHGVRAAGWRVPQHAAYIRERLDAGETIVAGPIARRNLELTGFRFQSLVDGDTPGFSISKAVDQLHCAVVRTDRWSLLPGLEYTGRLGIEIPSGPGGNLTLVIGDDDRPPVVVTNARGDVLKVDVEPLLTAPSADAPPPDYWFDGGDPARAPSQVVRLRLPAHPTATTLLDVSLGRRAPRVLARLMNLDGGARGQVCASPLATPELWNHANAAREVTIPLGAAALLTAGWYGVETDDGAGQYRWTGPSAVALIPSAVRAPVRVAIDAEQALRLGSGQAEMPTVTLRVNGVQQPSQVMQEGMRRYEWPIPASTWLSGTNELVFSVSRVLRPSDVGGKDARVLGMKVRRLTLTRED